MQKTNLFKKTIALFLIFTLTFANFALVTKSYAATFFDSVFASSSDTGTKNVEFDAYFENAEKEKSYSVISAVNGEDVNLNLNLAIQESGYLKNAQITIKESEEGSGLNFKVNGELEESDFVKSFENNIITLKQLNKDSQVNLSLPLTYFQEDYITENKLSQSFNVEVSGTYVNDKAEEKEVSKTVTLTLTWTDERDVQISSEVTKYIPYTVDDVNGVILQTLVTVDSTVEKSGAVKSTELKIEAPQIEGAEIEKVNVIAKTTEGTDGNKAENVKFSEDNWKFENGILTINKENEKVLVKKDVVNEENTLKEENESEEVEKYYSKSGKDEYLITYTIKNVSSLEQKLNSKVNANVTTLGKETLDNKAEKTFEYELSEQLGNIVTYEVQNDIESISKGYMYYNMVNDDENLYEIQYDSREVLNISYKDIVEEIFIEDSTNNYVDKEDGIHELNDVYYKTISISKSNFEKMLGEEGYIEILKDGNVIAKFTKEMEADENEIYTYTFDSYSVNGITVKTSKPIAEGNLILNVSKVQMKTNYDKPTFATFKNMSLNSEAKSKYTYVESLVDAGKAETKIKLEDTITKAELELSTNKFSTLASTDVEMKIKLNNEKIESDIYGNSIFEITLPENIEEFEITDYNIAYEAGLNLSNVEAYRNEEGKIVVKATVEGLQKTLSSGSITGGTNIVFNANVKVNKFTPLMEKEIVLTFENSEATGYANEAKDVKKITYSAPTGVVSVNSITNYDSNGNILTSVNQGTKKATIATFSEAINSKMEILVMNNNSNSIKNISILGRVPFEGNKDVLSGNELGTTVNTKLTSGIVSDPNNNTNFKIYYSSNGEATNDLNEESNGWKEEIDLGEIKSFLIIPEDTNYEMGVSDVLKFSYEFEVPENLEFNNDIYGSFATYYTNNIEEPTDEISGADLVYLTTGIGPKLEIQTTVDNDGRVTEDEELTITSKITNTGKVDLEDVRVTIPVPQGTTYSYAIVPDDTVTAEESEDSIIFNIPSIEIDGTREVSLKVMVNKIEVNENEDLELNSDNTLTNTIQINSSATAKNIPNPIVSEAVEVQIVVASLVVNVQEKYDTTTNIREETVGAFSITVTNTSSETLENVDVNLHIDPAFVVTDIFVTGETVEKVDGFDERAEDLVITLDKIDALSSRIIALNLKADKLDEGVTSKKAYIYASAENELVSKVNSNSIEYTIGKPILTINQRTNTDTYVKTGDTIEYVFELKNEGTYSTGEFEFKDEMPKGLFIKEASYTLNGETKLIGGSPSTVYQNLSLKAGEEAEIVVKTTVSTTESDEFSITNKAEVNAETIGQVESNSVTHIAEDVRAVTSNQNARTAQVVHATDSKVSQATYTNENSNTVSSSSLGDVVRSYKITGCVFVDDNDNGIRDSSEKMKSSTKVILVNADTGTIKDTVTTDSTGTYTFSGLEAGNYFIVFEYDSARYKLSAYQIEGASSTNNSDVISTTIEQDGQEYTAAVTDVIKLENGSVSNIDMGLVVANTFDLELTKTISKMTVQNEAGTSTNEFDNAKLAKVEIASKNLATSVVYIEYTIKVTNKGDVEGYAKSIVDYIPDGLVFNSSMNPEWFTGPDGNLYTTAFADKALAKGESEEIKLVLTKQMTEENTGAVNNTAEIAEDYNIYGLADVNSKAGNKVPSENDFGSADALISVKTGEVFIYTSVILTTVLLGGIAVFITINKLNLKKRKEGGV